MPKVAPGKVQFTACTISRSACTTKELPLQVCARTKNHAHERMAESYARSETQMRIREIQSMYREGRNLYRLIVSRTIFKFHKIFYNINC